MDLESDYQALLKEVRACRICEEYLPEGPRPVIRATTRAPILIVGQAPGRRVHASGIPFDDPSGDRLRAWLGVDRDTFYDPSKFAIVPMGFCYPGTGKSGDLPPRPECAPAWRHQVLGPLTNVRLTVVMGAYAIRWHLGGRRQSLTKTVGNWAEHWPDLVPLPHPSPRNIRWFKSNPWLEEDLIPALRERVSELLSPK